MQKIVGINIKHQRETIGYTLRELAKHINLSASFLSQVESGKVSPSLATLTKIANALQTTIGKLVGESETTGRVNPIIKDNNRIVLNEMGHGTIISLLASQDINNQMQPYTITFKQGADTGSLNKHAGQEFGLVIKGSVKLTLNEKQYILNPRDSFYFNANIPHGMVNLNKEESQVLIVATPPLF